MKWHIAPDDSGKVTQDCQSGLREVQRQDTSLDFASVEERIVDTHSTQRECRGGDGPD